MIFIDGENLSVRYERMVKDQGKLPNPNVLFDPARFLWHQNLAALWPLEIFRVLYYTSIVGTHDDLAALEDRISGVEWKFKSLVGQVVPRVFKKAKGGDKTKSVDINICIDVLRHCHASDVDVVVLMSGDGDYLPLLREVMRNGKQAYVAAFSDGLNPAIRRTVDSFQSLDRHFFQQ